MAATSALTGCLAHLAETGPMTTKTDKRADGQQARLLPRERIYGFAEGLDGPQSAVGGLRRRLIDLFDKATRRRVTLICAPAGTGKTAACWVWAAANARTRPVVWLTLESEDDQAWIWAWVCSGLKQAAVASPEILSSLEDGPPGGFALRLVTVARLFAEPVVIVLDNMDNATDEGVLKGLELLVRHAPPTLRLVLCGRRPPWLHLGRLRTSGELAEIGAADLSRVLRKAHRGSAASA
jgi:ATP/maltotriose-dependent transcriptional regulator MalT